MAHKVITGTAAAGGGTTRIPPIDSGNGNTWTPRRQARKVSGAAGRDGRTASVPVIRLSNVDVEYKDASDLTLKNVSLSIYPGEFVIVIGMSGAGKSTFLRLLNRTLVAKSGTVEIGGQDVGRLDADSVPMLRRQVGTVLTPSRGSSSRSLMVYLSVTSRLASFAVSMALPPPTATMKSAPLARNSSTSFWAWE